MRERMDIKIGLAESPRELSIRLPEGQDNVMAAFEDAIDAGRPTMKLEDEKGNSYLIRTERILYVEQASAAARSVGFMR